MIKQILIWLGLCSKAAAIASLETRFAEMIEMQAALAREILEIRLLANQTVTELRATKLHWTTHSEC